jgi:hypothetical protein
MACAGSIAQPFLTINNVFIFCQTVVPTRRKGPTEASRPGEAPPPRTCALLSRVLYHAGRVLGQESETRRQHGRPRGPLTHTCHSFRELVKAHVLLDSKVQVLETARGTQHRNHKLQISDHQPEPMRASSLVHSLRTRLTNPC